MAWIPAMDNPTIRPSQPWAESDCTWNSMVIMSRAPTVADTRGGATWTRQDMPDGAMALAIVAACASDPTRLIGLETLRVKECDRVAALDAELRKTGADVSIDGDDLVIRPPSDQQATASPSAIETYDDHRMAMAFAILGLRQGGADHRRPRLRGQELPRLLG